MRALISSFSQFCNQIAKDSMLLMVCIAPFLCGMFFKFGIPFAETALTSYFHLSSIFAPYYLAFDLFFAILTSYMFCFASAMVILGEIDDNISNYLAATPIGKSGYLISRIGFPTILSIVVTCILFPVFSLTKLSFMMILLVSILSGFSSIIASMLIITFSTNKVEGMALAKLAGLIMLGTPIPFFVTGKEQYLAFFLPSFWLAKLAIETNYCYSIGALASSAVWGYLLYKKFIRKVL